MPSDDRVPLLARRDEGWIRTLQLAWDGINHDWRRNVVGFNFEQQRMLWRYFQLERWAPWQVVLGVALLTAAWAGGLLLWFALRHRQRDDRIVLSWNALCRRLARAGLPREAHEGPLAYLQRAATRWPAFAAAFMVMGEAYAELRYGRTATAPGAEIDRVLARFRHAIAVLPTARTLRRSGLPA